MSLKSFLISFRQSSVWLCLMSLCLTVGSCSSVERTVRRAEAAEAIGEHLEAANLYRMAYRATPTKERSRRGLLAFRMGEACHRHGNSARALGAYRSAERYGFTDSLTYLRLGQHSALAGDYKAAETYFSQYLALHPDDVLAQAGLTAARTAPAIKAAGSDYTVSPDRLFGGSRSDFAPSFGSPDGSSLFFSTTRSSVTGNELSGITGMKNGDIFFSRKDEKGAWKSPEPAEGINTELDEGTPAFTPDGQTMYFTACPVDGSYPRMAEIRRSSRSDAKWNKPETVKLTADTLSSYAHPAVSPDGRYLYFVSDMPGGYGGLDLWRAVMDSHGLGSVENLGPDINTPGDEMFPTFRPNGELYFSSDGRSPSLGGLDIYRAREDTLHHTWTVVHLPYPVNSQGNDFGMTFEGIYNRGYFSSSRSTGGRGWDKLFTFSCPEQVQSVKGWVYEQDGYELPDATVYMVGNDGSSLAFGVRPDGSFEQRLEPGVSYVLLATSPGHLNCRGEVVADSAEITRQTVLQFPLASISIPVLVRGVYYAFDDDVVIETSRPALERLAKLLKENPHVTIELSAHCDWRGSDDYNDRLSQRRAESVVRFLKEQGIAPDRLTAVGYGERRPRVISKKMAENYDFLKEGDTLTTDFILRLTPEQQEACNALNRRTEFRVLRTTYGLFTSDGKLRPEALTPRREPNQ